MFKMSWWRWYQEYTAGQKGSAGFIYARVKDCQPSFKQFRLISSETWLKVDDDDEK